jgi:hypothetical protein
MPTFPAAVRLLIVLTGVAGACIAGTVTLAAGVFRCPDGSYQDKPCGEGGKLVTSTTREAPPEKGQDAQCLGRAKLAEKFARDKAGGATPEAILARVDKEMMPYEERVARKKFAAEVLQMKGGPAEVRATVEADCMEQKNAAARDAERAAQQAKVQEDARARECESARRELQSAKTAERGGGSIDSLDSLRAVTRSAEARMRKSCG